MAVLLSPVGGVAGQFFDNNGVPLAGGKIFTYGAGTTTNQATYTSAAGAVAHTNPIILDGGGRVPSGEIWLTDGLTYKFVLKNASDVLIGTYDNIVGINSNFVNFQVETEVQTATAGQTVFTLATMQYAPGTNNLSVFVDGVNQIDGAIYSYVETDSTTVTFTTGLHVGALVKFTTAITLSTGVVDSSLVTYQPAGVGAVATTVQAKLRETISVKDFGAVGDGISDDTVAIQAAIDYSSNYQIVQGVGGDNYRITSTLNLNGKFFDGQNCTIIKDFVGTGILITGGSVYTYLRDFTIVASVAHAASDYDPTAAEHGINFSNTRVEIFDVTSNSHKGAGFYANQTAGNMNKCKLIRIAAGNNALAGCYFDGNYPTADNMSVWEFNGRFQFNYGHGIFVTTTCPARSFDMWIYAESNFIGAAAAGITDGAVDFGRLQSSDIWAYVEQQVNGNELVLRANCDSNYIRSVRANTDKDFSTTNIWFWSSGRITSPRADAGFRQVVLPGFAGLAARVTTPGEYLRVNYQGNGGNFGFIQGEGGAGGTQKIGLLSHDALTEISVRSGRFTSNAPDERYGQVTNRQVVNFIEVAPVGNQIKIVVTVSDVVPLYGTGLLDIYLGANTGSSSQRIYHKAFLAFASRNGTSLSSWDAAETIQASNGFTLNSVTVSGLQATILYDVNAVAVGVSGHVLCNGASGFMVSAVLAAP